MDETDIMGVFWRPIDQDLGWVAYIVVLLGYGIEHLCILWDKNKRYSLYYANN